MSGNGAKTTTIAAGAATQGRASGTSGQVLSDVGAAVLVCLPLRVLAVARAVDALAEVAAALRAGGRLAPRRLARRVDRAASVIAEANGELSAAIRLGRRQ